MAGVPPVALTGVLLLCLLVIVFDLKASVGSSAYVARLGLGVRGGEESPDPPIVIHALFAPSVLAALPLDPVIVLLKWLGAGALGAGLHGCPFPIAFLPPPSSLAAPAPISLRRVSGVCGGAAR